MVRFGPTGVLLGFALGLAVTDFPPRPAVAQTADAEEIIITGAAFGQRRFDALQGNSILLGDALERARETSLGETLAREPGISSTYFGPVASRPVIRGQAGERLRVLINGIGTVDVSTTSPDHQVASDPLVAERIEVLKGPSALLYGPNAAAGVVNVIDGRIPERPGEETLTGRLIGSFGSAADERSIAGRLDLTLGNFVLHGDGFARESDDLAVGGFARSEALRAAEPLPAGEEEDKGFVPNTDADSHGVTFGGSYVRENGYFGVSVGTLDSNYGIPEVREPPDPDAQEEEEGVRIDLDQIRLDAAGELRRAFGPFSALRFRGGYADFEQEEIEGGEVGTRFENDGGEARLELVQRRFGPLDGVLGFQFRDRDFAATGEEAFVPPNRTRQWGFFAVERLDLGRWTLEGGLRFDRQHSKASDPGVERDFDLVSVSGGVAFAPDADTLLGFRVSHTERAPAPEELFSNGLHLAIDAFEIGDPALAVERGNGGEVTAQTALGPITARVSGYVTWYDNFVIENFTDEERSGVRILRFEASDARFAGFEATLGAPLYEGPEYTLSADFSVDYVRATDTTLDKPLPRIPSMTWQGGFAVESRWFDGRIEIARTDAQTRIASFETATGGHTFLNASLTLRPWQGRDDVRIMIRGNNLTDEPARNHVSFLKDRVPLPGRDVRLSLLAGF